jgi:hypothetical protein
MAKPRRLPKLPPPTAAAAYMPLPNPPPPPPMDPRKTTSAMRESLEHLQQSLQCPLCSNRLTQPSTLPCSHTFCYPCIESYSCNSWHCPGK